MKITCIWVDSFACFWLMNAKCHETTIIIILYEKNWTSLIIALSISPERYNKWFSWIICLWTTKFLQWQNLNVKIQQKSLCDGLKPQLNPLYPKIWYIRRVLTEKTKVEFIKQNISSDLYDDAGTKFSFIMELYIR